MDHYDSLYDFVIHVALIVTSNVPLITSFQLPTAHHVATEVKKVG